MFDFHFLLYMLSDGSSRLIKQWLGEAENEFRGYRDPY